MNEKPDKITVQNCGCGCSNNSSKSCCTDKSVFAVPYNQEMQEQKNAAQFDSGSYIQRDVSVVYTRLTFSDKLGAWKVRWGIGRMRYRVEPGLYAVGVPDSHSPVLVTSNYTMSFDAVRSQLNGRSVWILVLETDGVNVWCAAGKGTFGTSELVARIDAVRLSEVVSHRTLILPQLGASGVSAHEVKRQSGFKVVYGPVRADDIPAFLDAGMKATAEMRRVRFPFRDRAVLIPIELMLSLKYVTVLALMFFLFSGLSRSGFSVDRAVSDGVDAVIGIFFAVMGGTVVIPLLLPWIPGRAFSLKGFWVGLIIAALFALGFSGPGSGFITVVSWFFIVPAITSFLAMNFTGATTFTSLSGVKKEVRIALPLQATAASLGVVMWLVSRFF